MKYDKILCAAANIRSHGEFQGKIMKIFKIVILEDKNVLNGIERCDGITKVFAGTVVPPIPWISACIERQRFYDSSSPFITNETCEIWARWQFDFT